MQFIQNFVDYFGSFVIIHTKEFFLSLEIVLVHFFLQYIHIFQNRISTFVYSEENLQADNEALIINDWGAQKNTRHNVQ